MKSILFLSLFGLSTWAFADVCVVEQYDGKPKPAVFAVKFLGPHNGFWSYVSEDPKTWSFAFRRLDAKALTDLDHDAHFELGANNKFISLDGQLEFKDGKVVIPSAKVKEAIDTMLASLQKAKKLQTGSPSIEDQTVKLSITFQDAELAGVEEHICTFGFGTNSVRLQTDLVLNNLNFDVQLNGVADSGNDPDEVSLKRTANFIFSKGPTKIQGLPWSAVEFFNGKKQMAAENRIVYLAGLKQHCDLVVKKNDQQFASKPADKTSGKTPAKTDAVKAPFAWLVTKNSCSKIK